MAIAVSAVILLTIRVMADIVGSGGTAVSAAAQAADESMNAERQLRALVGSATVAEGASQRFEGRRDSLAFATWCTTANGWHEPCRVSIVVHNGRGGVVVLRVPGASPVELWRHGAPIFLEYLVPSVSRDAWTTDWSSSTALPLAIAVLGSDTVVVRIGERG